jgi:hypothetical protein
VRHPRRRLLNAALLLGCVLALGGARAEAARTDHAARLFERGLTWDQFLGGAKAQRDAWLKTAATAANSPSPELIARFRRVAAQLRMVIVAEDWCPDSVNVVPYIAALATAAAVPLRIIGRTAGQPLMDTHRTPDGRSATPTVVLLRGDDDIGAWVERPAVIQQWFLSMTTDPENARRFAERQSWYDADRGRTVLGEVIAIAERTAAGR